MLNREVFQTRRGNQTCLWVLLLAALLPGCQPAVPTGPAPNMDRAVALRSIMGSVDLDGATDDALGEALGPEPTGWTTLKGRFVMDGEPPSLTRLRVDKDVAVCAPGGRNVFSEDLLVDANGGLKNVVLFLSTKLPSDEPWTHGSMAPGWSEDVEFDQKECIFLTHVLAMQTSQPLKLMNSDPVGHNAKMDPPNNPKFNQIIPANAHTMYRASREVQAPFPVACSIHPWMSAWILFRDNGYFAVTESDGSFEIPYLPAGIELEFRVWHQRTGFLSQVNVGGKTETWRRGAFTIKLNESDLAPENNLEVALSASLFQ